MPDVGPDTGPSFRLWPPVSVGVPLLAGLLLTWNVGDPWGGSGLATALGWIRLGVFAVWNGWSLVAMGRHGTGLLPGQATTTILYPAPFGLAPTPLYVGLLLLPAGVALLAASLCALLA